jgi:hypothetical protein
MGILTGKFLWNLVLTEVLVNLKVLYSQELTRHLQLLQAVLILTLYLMRGYGVMGYLQALRSFGLLLEFLQMMARPLILGLRHRL